MNPLKLTLIVHIAAGCIAVASGLVAMLAPKGRRLHRFTGRSFFAGMAVVALTALTLAIAKHLFFLGAVGVFSFYLAASGYRALYRKKPVQGTGLDFLLVFSGLSGGAALWIFAITHHFQGTALVATVLGTAALGLGGRDLYRSFRPVSAPMGWWFTHMTRMLAAYIATITAVSVVNLPFLPELARWLWPTVIGSIGIQLWTRYYARRFQARRANAGALS